MTSKYKVAIKLAQVLEFGVLNLAIAKEKNFKWVLWQERIHHPTILYFDTKKQYIQTPCLVNVIC